MREYRVLSSFLEENNYKLTPYQKEQFDLYFDRMVQVNREFNLTNIVEFNEAEQKHFLDSAAIIQYIDLNRISSMIDVGTGAGFPGIPIKILFPHIHIILLDSLQKRVNFLKNIINELNLSNITAIHGRAEDLAKQVEYRENFDLCVSRAVASLRVLAELCIPFVKIGGMFIPYKSSAVYEEIPDAKNAIEITGGKILDCYKCQIGEDSLVRAFPLISKTSPTPEKYPRKAGIPAKNPL